MFKENEFNKDLSFEFPDRCSMDFTAENLTFYIITSGPFDFWIEIEPAKKEDLCAAMLKRVIDNEYVLNTEPYEIHRSGLKGIAAFYSKPDKKREFYSEKYRLFLCGQLMDFTVFVESSEIIADEMNIAKPPLKKILQYPVVKRFFESISSLVGK